MQLPVTEKIILATFLCETTNNAFLQFHRPDWNEKISAGIEEKLALANHSFAITDIFPWQQDLSAGINHAQLAAAYLQQPFLFIRIRPGKKNMVIKKLQSAGFYFELVDDDCIALANATKLDGLLELDIEAVVQDCNSQKVLDYLKHHPAAAFPVPTWDCCAASGGKSILAYDILDGKIELTVSDIRESILSNLKKRFSAAGILGYQSFLIDLTTANCQLPTGQAGCQLLICDAPCTGSGTWSRTPEQLYYFKRAQINAFTAIQKNIVSRVIPILQDGGLFFYITCSVFAEENENIASFIKEKFHLQLLQMELLRGYDKRADNMFVAVFSK